MYFSPFLEQKWQNYITNKSCHLKKSDIWEFFMTKLLLYEPPAHLQNFLHYDGGLVAWPQWWSFEDMSQQGSDFRKKISKIIIFFWFDFHRCCQKVPESDFQSQFSTSKIIRIFLIFFSLKNISLGACFLFLSFFENFNFWTTLFTKMVPNFWWFVWTIVN